LVERSSIAFKENNRIWVSQGEENNDRNLVPGQLGAFCKVMLQSRAGPALCIEVFLPPGIKNARLDLEKRKKLEIIPPLASQGYGVTCAQDQATVYSF
jgi:hypothetical protein